MNPVRRLFLLCLAALSVSVSFVPLGAADPEAKEIERLVKQLGSTRFKDREAAMRRLKVIGEPALDALLLATSSSDLEVRRRAEHLFAFIEDKVCVEQLRLVGHKEGWVYSICTSGDGKRVLTSSGDRTLRLWDAQTGKCLRVFQGHTHDVRGAALSPDGKYVLSGSRDHTLRLWDAETGRELRTMTGHTHEVRSVAFGPEGQALSFSNDGTMRLWDLHTGENIGVFRGHTGQATGLAYSETAKLAATCDNDATIRLWNLGTSKEVRRFNTGWPNGETGICFSPDGKRVLTTGGESQNDRPWCIWDVATGKNLKRIKDAHASCARFSPDGKRLVTGSWACRLGRPDHSVRVWDATTGKEVRRYEGHAGRVSCVCFFPDGKRVASGSEDGTVRIWGAPR